MDTKDKLIGIAMILVGVAFIVLGSAVLARTGRTNSKEPSSNIYNEQQVNNSIYQEI